MSLSEVKKVEGELLELQELFLVMATLVESQGDGARRGSDRGGAAGGLAATRLHATEEDVVGRGARGTAAHRIGRREKRERL